jgi:large subunit ribosomal protein L25
MSQQLELNAELRTDVGKGASRRLRRSGDKVPAIIYGGGEDTVALTLDYHQLVKAMQSESFFSQILAVTTNGKAQQAVIRDMQRHPANDKVTHIDFLRVRADVAIQVNIPLRYINEDNCVGVRLGGGSIGHNLMEVEVSCLPGDLPEAIEVDMENIDVGDAIHLSDLTVPQGVTLVELALGEGHDQTIASVNIIREIEEEEEVIEGEELAEGEEPTEDEGEGEGEEESDEED